MVLWEITAATAYFLGLKRTYRIALRLQRRVVPSKYPKISHFLQRRTRNIFDMAVKVHRNIQERDLEVGRSLGNWILRWLDRMKPSAQIRPHPPSIGNKSPKQLNTHSTPHVMQRPNVKATDQESNGHHHFTSLNIRSKSSSTISLMMQPKRLAGISGQYRHLSYTVPPSPAISYRRGQFESIISGVNHRRSQFQGFLRRDIAQYMLHN